jgi:hypothetical protein
MIWMTFSSFVPSSWPIASESAFFCSKESTSDSSSLPLLFLLDLPDGATGLGAFGLDEDATGVGGGLGAFFFSFFGLTTSGGGPPLSAARLRRMVSI